MYIEYLHLYFVFMRVSACVKEALEYVQKGICKEYHCNNISAVWSFSFVKIVPSDYMVYSVKKNLSDKPLM